MKRARGGPAAGAAGPASRGVRAAGAAGGAATVRPDWRERAKPIEEGRPYPAGEHCSRCGLCDTYFVAHVGEACAFLGDGMGRVEQLEGPVHGRGRRWTAADGAPDDELYFGVHEEMVAARMAPGRPHAAQEGAGAQWTGIITSIAIEMLESGRVEAVVCVQSDPDDPLKPRPAIARTRQEVLDARGVKPSLSSNLEVLAEVEAAGFKRLLFIGVGCQVTALRSVEKYLGLEKLYVLGTPCTDNGPPEGLRKFLETASEDPDTVQGYEFMQDYRVHLKHYDGTYEKLPYFCLPADDLKDVIAPSCYSCFDYVNGLADLVVGYMGVPWSGDEMTAHMQFVTIRNERGREMFDAVRDRMDVAPTVDTGDRKAFVMETLLTDDRAAIGKKSNPAPRFVGEILAELLEKVGPKGLEFARYSIEYHTLRNILYVLRNYRPKQADRQIPNYAKELLSFYDEGGAISARAQLTSWEEEARLMQPLFRAEALVPAGLKPAVVPAAVLLGPLAPLALGVCALHFLGAA